MNADILAPVVRISLRWLGGFLIAKGLAHDANAFTDPELVTVVCYASAAMCGVISEGWYYAARKMGWAT